MWAIISYGYITNINIGKNKYGELGNPALKKDLIVDKPILVEFFQKNNLKVEKVVCDSNHTLVLTKGGRVFSFGNGKYSRFYALSFLFAKTLALGHESNDIVTVPKMIKKFSGLKIKDISTNKHSALAVDDNNKLYVWGRGEFGVNGMGNSDSIQTPTENPIMTKIIESLGNPKIKKLVSCSDFSSVLLDNGDVYSFGNNDQGIMGLENNLGVDMTESISFPQPMFRPSMKYNDKDIKVIDLDLGEVYSILKVENENHETAIFWGGRKLAVKPELIKYDFMEDKPVCIGACDRGVAFTTESNKLVNLNQFLNITAKDPETGLNIVDIGEQFGPGLVTSIGGRYADRFLMIEE